MKRYLIYIIFALLDVTSFAQESVLPDSSRFDYLSSYYSSKGDYDKAFEVNNEMYDYVMAHTDRTNPVWCDILYQQGAVLGQQGKLPM